MRTTCPRCRTRYDVPTAEVIEAAYRAAARRGRRDAKAFAARMAAMELRDRPARAVRLAREKAMEAQT